MELLKNMLQRDKDEFKRIANRLLSQCFLCKGNVTNKSDYYFVLKYRTEFQDCPFSGIGLKSARSLAWFS